MSTSKEVAEKIHMFNNLLYHLDDYIKNKKERKGQLHLLKSIRLVLREIISSKKSIKYFLSKEDIDLHLGIFLDAKKTKKEDESYKKMKSITPLGFNQKNLNTLNYFYNSKNESYVLNYIILEKIFSIIRYCFIETIKKAKKEFINNFENMNKNNFLFRKIDNYETFSLIENKISYTGKNNFLKNDVMMKMEEEFDTSSTNKGIKKISSNNIFNAKKMDDSFKKTHAYVNISSLINNNYNCNNIISNQEIQNNNNIKNNTNLLRNLRWQIKKVDNRIWLSKIKLKKDRQMMKKHSSFPLIKSNNVIISKSLEKLRKKENDDSSLINENKTEIKNVVGNIIKLKKINFPRKSALYKQKLIIQNKSNNNYDYNKLFPYFKMPKIKISNK